MNNFFKNCSPLVIFASLSLAAIAGCSENPAESNDEPVKKIAKPTLPFNEKDPATWVLPIQGYLPSDSARAQIAQAKKQLVGDCMKSFGFTWVLPPDLPKIGGKTLVDWRYGIHDLTLAKERGYKPDVEEQAAYDKAMTEGAVDNLTGGVDSQTLEGGGVKEVNGKKVPEGGCLGQADRRINAQAAQAATAQNISSETFTRSKEEPEVVKAFAAWSACMKTEGYNYSAPLEASDDPHFATREVTAPEIATATADIGCRNKTNVTRIWFDAESALQNKAIESKAEQLNQDHEALDAAVKKAAEVVAGTR